MANTAICEIKTNRIQTAQRLISGNYRRLFRAPATEEYVLDVIDSLELPNAILFQIGKIRKDDLHYCKYGKTTDFDHSIGVMELAILYGKTQGCPDSVIKRLGLAAQLHDIIKPTKFTHLDRHLTKEEQLTMKMHPFQSYEFLRNNGIKDDYILDGALRHHVWIKPNKNSHFESYPAYVGEPGLAARIIAIMDATDAIARGRPFRRREEFKNGSVQNATDELLRESDEDNPDGIHFDREIVSKFIPILKRAI